MPFDHWTPNRRVLLQGAAAGAAMWPFLDLAVAQENDPPSLDEYERQFFTPDEWAFILAATARLIPSGGDGPGALEARVPIFIDRQMAGDFGQGADWYMQGPHRPDSDPLLGFQSPLTPGQIYRQGIAFFDGWCRDRMGAAFADLDEEAQDKALTALEGKQGSQPQPSQDGQGGQFAEFSSDAEGGQATSASGHVDMPAELRNFFPFLLQNTKEGYFADPMYGGNYGMAAWVYIGFPGARANFREWVDKDNVPYPLGPVSISGERA